MPHRIVQAFILCLTVIVLPLTGISTQSPTAPRQPDHGPGGKDYSHNRVIRTRYGEGAQEYWIFEPDAPKPRSSPLIIFLHGWGGTNPMYYGAWLEHLVKRGNIVVYPRYQSDLLTPRSEFVPNTIRAIKNAIGRLQTERGHVRPDLNRFAVVGHSLGGLLAADVAVLGSESGLPQVRAIMCVEPGITEYPISIPLADLGKIRSETLLLAVAGEQDTLVRDTDAKKIYYESTRVPARNKDFITLVSDTHGTPALNANHRAPTAPDKSYDNGESTTRGGAKGPESAGGLRGALSQVLRRSRRGPSELRTADALDFYGTWKLFDGLCDAAFYGKNREYALGNTSQQRFMGVWSDGVPVKQLRVISTP